MNHYIDTSDGRVRLWIEQESLHLIAVDSHGDPVEISTDDAIKLANSLMAFVKLIDPGQDLSSVASEPA